MTLDRLGTWQGTRMGFFVWKQVCKLRAELEQMRAKRFFMVLGSVLVLPLARAR